MKFPRGAPKRKVIKTLETPGFKMVRVRKHISMVRESPDGPKTPLLLRSLNRLYFSSHSEWSEAEPRNLFQAKSDFSAHGACPELVPGVRSK